MSATHSLTIDPSGDWQSIVRRHIESLNFGSVQIVIHDSRVVEIDKTERFRLAPTRQARLRGQTNIAAPAVLPTQAALPVHPRV